MIFTGKRNTHDRYKQASFDQVDMNETLLEDHELKMNISIITIFYLLKKLTWIPASIQDNNTISRKKINS